jgi:hypothetical protein
MNIYALVMNLISTDCKLMLMKYLMIRNGYVMHAYIDDYCRHHSRKNRRLIGKNRQNRDFLKTKNHDFLRFEKIAIKLEKIVNYA